VTRWLLLVCALAVMLPSRSRAQALGGNEMVAGSALNLLLRAPYVARSWRRPVPRFLLAQAVSLTYELAIDANGWNRRDVGGRVQGYAITEALVFLVRRVIQ
jgi:hypothetical protein